MVLYICEKFHNNDYLKVFHLQSRHKYMVEMAMFIVQRAISPKVDKPEFMCSASLFIVFYTCVVL